MNTILIFIFLILIISCCLSDLAHRIIPNEITIPGSILGIFLNGNLDNGLGFEGAVLAWILGCACILLSGSINWLRYGKEGIGGGDLQLMGMVGAFWGWKVVLATYAIAPFIASAWHVKTLKSSMAYGVAIGEAAVIAMFLFK